MPHSPATAYDRYEPLKVDLRVDHGGVDAPMAQDIGDLLTGHTSIQHAAGGAVPEDMNACLRPAATFVGSENGTRYDVFVDRPVIRRKDEAQDRR